VSDERPQETIEPASDAAEPKFPNCWADAEREMISVEVNGVTFRMRSITVGEERRIADEMNMRWKFKRTGTNPEDIAVDLGDEMTIVVSDHKSKQILTVTASLGAWTKYGSEGWTDSRKVTPETIEAMKGDVLEALYLEYVSHFRSF
jgi:hypothetical protein